jgi:hypothetical protein
LEGKNIMAITISSAAWDGEPLGEVVISGATPTRLGKVEPGDYTLETPYGYACAQMMSLPSVKKLLISGELPHLRFGKQFYVVTKINPRR